MPSLKPFTAPNTTSKWGTMETDPAFSGNEWNSTTITTTGGGGGGRASSAAGIGYDPYHDKHLKFQSHSAPHRKVKDNQRRLENIDAQRRLELQRQAYRNVVSNAVSLATLKDPSFLASAKKPAANEPSAFDVFERAKGKCVALWSELDVDEAHRAHLSAQYFNLSAGEEPSADRIAAIHEEIERLLNQRRLEKEIEFCIRVREGFVYRLLELAERSAVLHMSELDAQLKPLVINLRKATVDVCTAVASWRAVLGYDAMFLWRGTSYILKMSSDLNTLGAFETMVKRFPCRIVGNPLLDVDLPNPGRVLLRGEAAAEKPLMPIRSTLLPPMLRPAGQQADGSIISPEMLQRAKAMIDAEPARFAEFQRNAPVHTFDLVDGSTFDPNVVKQLKDAVFNEAHAALDFHHLALAGSQQNPGDDLTPHQRLMIVASLHIQRLWRGHCARKVVKVFRTQHMAARRIQRVHRVIAAREEVDKRRLRHLAAAKIQGLARGVATRSAMRKFFALNRTAIVLQTAWRAFRARRYVRYLRELSYCAKAIQRWYRGHLARRWVPVKKATRQHHAAQQIQRVWRGGQQRVVMTANPRAIKAATKIQTAWRRHVATQYVAKLRGVRNAALLIQRRFGPPPSTPSSTLI